MIFLRYYVQLFYYIYNFLKDTGPFIITIIGFFIIYRQLKLIRKQLNLTAFSDIHKELHSPQGKEDRKFVYNLPDNYDFSKILDQKKMKKQKEKIERVCDSFEHAGLLIKADLIDKELFFKSFYTVLIKCWNKLENYVNLRRKDNKRYAKYFKEIIEECQKWVEEENLEV